MKVPTTAILGLGLATLTIAGPAWAGPTLRVSVSDSGVQAQGPSGGPSIAAGGRFVVCTSFAHNLVPGDTNRLSDVFVRDLRDGTTRRVSVASGGAQSNGQSLPDYGGPAISANGRFVAFESNGSNLVADDTNASADIFLRDRSTKLTTRVSVGPDGAEANAESHFPAISGDGRFVAFYSYADNLVAGDSNLRTDIFVHDGLTGVTSRVSVGPAGQQANAGSLVPALSRDGRFVSFESMASNLVAGDAGFDPDVFVHDRTLGRTERISMGPGGAEPDGDSNEPVLSADGGLVAYYSDAANLVPQDTNSSTDVFVHDRRDGTTRRVSVGQGGTQADAYSFLAALSADGRFVAFSSAATNLVANDTNGVTDIFIRDRRAGRTSRMSLGQGGVQANADSNDATVSAYAGAVAFFSEATNLVPADTNGVPDVFVRQR